MVTDCSRAFAMPSPVADRLPGRACFLAPSLTEAARGSQVCIGGDEGRHAVSVRRVRAGQTVSLTDGLGRLADGEVVGCGPPDRLTVVIDRVWFVPRPDPRIEVALGVLKGDRMARAVEQLTEVGVDRIIPVLTDRCVVRWPPGRETAEIGRLRRRVAEATKQSRRPWLAEVTAPSSLSELLVDGDRRLVLLDPSGLPARAGGFGRRGVAPGRTVLVLVGPEGGFTELEVDAIRAAGADCLRLGPTVMRAGTAALAGVVALSMTAGRWQTGDRD